MCTSFNVCNINLLLSKGAVPLASSSWESGSYPTNFRTDGYIFLNHLIITLKIPLWGNWGDGSKVKSEIFACGFQQWPTVLTSHYEISICWYSLHSQSKSGLMRAPGLFPDGYVGAWSPPRRFPCALFSRDTVCSPLIKTFFLAAGTSVLQGRKSNFFFILPMYSSDRSL